MTDPHDSYIRIQELSVTFIKKVFISDIPGLSHPLVHETLLDELVFWMVKYEFPQDVVTLLLSILSDDDYKVIRLIVIKFINCGMYI